MKSISLLSILLTLGLIAQFQNCSPTDYSFEQSAKRVPTDEEHKRNEEEVNRKCGATTPTVQTVNVFFDNPGRTCPWNVDGNLAPRDLYFQGRIEQTHTFTLPTNSTLCDLEFNFANQSFRFDDMFILTLNDAVIASSYNYFPRFRAVNNLSIYEWSAIAGMGWDTREEGVFCTGRAQGQANCSWPSTDTPGSISMNYDEAVIRSVFALDPTKNEHRFDIISIGDNDDNDCEHSPISFTVRASYVTQ